MKTPWDREEERRERKHAYRIHAPGEFYTTRFDWWRVLKKADLVAMFSAMVNLSQAVNAAERKNGWFYYSIRRVEKQFGFSRNTQARLLRVLRGLKLVRRKTAGPSAHREFKINYPRLEELIAQSRTRDDEDSDDLPFDDD